MTAPPSADPKPVRVLVAEDDSRTRQALAFLLERHGYAITCVRDGQAAFAILMQADPPSIVLLDWEMPQLDGLHVCRAIRTMPHQHYIYVIMVTARDSAADLAEAFAAGADDFLSKPVDTAQLLARMRSGERVLALEGRLAARIAELEHTLAEMRKLKRLLPICMYCKKIRDDNDYWQEMEVYLHDHGGTDFSHGICPSCMTTVVAGEFPSAIKVPGNG